MKKNKMMRTASVLLVAALMTTSMISGTFAKYTTSVEAGDTAVVAKWSVGATLNNASFGSATDSKTVDIFSQSAVYDTKDANYKSDGTVDKNVIEATDGTAIIAPGTWGKFTYTLSNDSDVNATYAVTYTVDEKNVPLEWSTNGSTWTDNLSNIADTAINMPTIKGTATTIDQTVYWRWAFEGKDSSVNTTAQTDTADTTLGTAETLANPSVKIAVTFTQVD